MARTNYDEERLREALARDTIQVDDSVARIDEEIYHRELYQALPWKVILGGFGEYEKRLLILSMVEEMSAKEVAQALGTDISKVRYDLNKLRAKIRARVKRLLKQDEAANKLLLTWEQIHTKGNRIAS
jgi:DNA-directed RNA polymerase specialized sigma24 family protein